MIKLSIQPVQFERRHQFAMWSGLFLFCFTATLFAAEKKADDPLVAKRPVFNQAETPHDLTVEELAEKAKESVVSVTFEGRDGQQAGLGTGFVIDAKGLIATNLHVIGEARPITVQLFDGNKYDVKEVYATDRLMDLAVLRIDADNLTPLSLAEPDSLKQGAEIIVRVLRRNGIIE